MTHVPRATREEKERLQIELTHGEAEVIERVLRDWTEVCERSGLNVLNDERSALRKVRSRLDPPIERLTGIPF